ncbi:hypothetical protein ALC57_17392 [Trachymyrmex cornetzi]|uniref:Uncharacterized protein n=1 Tax=Trachymyrmex cornetzi TaxID=471704 RepID=A0A151ITP9_9HYME|nr:hypothetical protein ALC57_17392 [Trachymyrmex cornetzi]
MPKISSRLNMRRTSLFEQLIAPCLTTGPIGPPRGSEAAKCSRKDTQHASTGSDKYTRLALRGTQSEPGVNPHDVMNGHSKRYFSSRAS